MIVTVNLLAKNVSVRFSFAMNVSGKDTIYIEKLLASVSMNSVRY